MAEIQETVLLATCLRLAGFIYLTIAVFRTYLRFSVKKTCALLLLFMLAVMVAVLLILVPLYDSMPEIRWYFSFVITVSAVFFFKWILQISFLQCGFFLLIHKSYSDNLALLKIAIESQLFVLPANDIPSIQGSLLEGVLLLVTLPSLRIFFKKMVEPLFKIKATNSFWRYLWMIPCSFYFICRFCVYPYYGGIANNSNPTVFFWVLVAWISTTILTYWVILRMLREVEANTQSQEQLHISNLQAAMQKEQYAKLRDNIETFRRIRHDLRHHMVVIKSFADREEFDKIEAYIEQYLAQLSTGEEMAFCENDTVNAIAGYYLLFARKQGVEVSSDLEIPAQSPIPENDLCIVIGNLLENAVEACVRQSQGVKFIQIKAKWTEGQTFAVTVQNSFDHTIQYAENAYVSQKRDGDGIGISSVRGITEKYCGAAHFAHEHGVFCAEAMLRPQREA